MDGYESRPLLALPLRSMRWDNSPQDGAPYHYFAMPSSVLCQDLHVCSCCTGMLLVQPLPDGEEDIIDGGVTVLRRRCCFAHHPSTGRVVGGHEQHRRQTTLLEVYHPTHKQMLATKIGNERFSIIHHHPHDDRTEK